MDVASAIDELRRGGKILWPEAAVTLDFAKTLDQDDRLVNFRHEFVVPTKTNLKTRNLNQQPKDEATHLSYNESAIYFCGNSLGLQSKAVSRYLSSYLQTWQTVAVGSHFTRMENSPLVPFQDMAAECARQSADIFGAAAEEIVIMNTLTANLHLMMAAFYKPTQQKYKILVEWRPFPSDWYAVESHVEWHGYNAKDTMLLAKPDEGSYIIPTSKILSLITEHADELALVLLPGIQYYSGQLLDIQTITAHAHAHKVTIGWDLAHAAGNAELKLHEWDVDFACWCTYKYLNAGAGAIAGAFIHEKHGDVVQNGGLRGWYGGDKSVRFLMDNKFVPTPGAQGFQLSNPSIVDLTCLSASLSVFNKTSMSALRSKSLLLTTYAEHLLGNIIAKSAETKPPLRIITPIDPTQRGAQLSVLIRSDLMDRVSERLEASGIVCDKRKPDCIRVAPAPLYNTFADVWQFMEVLSAAVGKESHHAHDLGHG